MSGPSGHGGTSLEDCTSRCALHDAGLGSCAILAVARREPAPPDDGGLPADGRDGRHGDELAVRWIPPVFVNGEGEAVDIAHERRPTDGAVAFQSRPPFVRCAAMPTPCQRAGSEAP